MKKNKNLLIVLMTLLVISTVFYFKNNKSSIKRELKDFAFKDTSAITKVFLADKRGNTITLEKTNNGWLVNGKYKPSRDVKDNLMKAIYSISVKTPVANAAYNNVLKQLAATGIKCEIYINSKTEPEKVYYVGHHTEDATGTFMMLEQSSAPFITEIPGFNGYLTPRYTTDIYDWRDRTLFSSKANDINYISVNYSAFPEKSFRLENQNGKFQLQTNDKVDVNGTDSTGIQNYIDLYSFISFEAWTTKMSSGKRDSILADKPSIIIGVDSKNNGYKEISIYPMPINEGSLERNDNQGRPLQYDADRMYGFIEPDKELVTIQHFIFDRILRQREDFLMKPYSASHR